jgi:hypothetical protein
LVARPLSTLALESETRSWSSQQDFYFSPINFPLLIIDDLWENAQAAL